MRAGETSQEVKNDENMYSLPFDNQKISSNENSLKEKKKRNGENLTILVAIFALILILIGINIVLYWDYTTKYKELSQNQENLAEKVENLENLNQEIAATGDEYLTDKYEDLTSKLLTMENFVKKHS